MARRTDTGEGRSPAVPPGTGDCGPGQDQGMARKAKNQAKSLAQGAKQQTRKMAARARGEVEEIVGRRKGQAADRLGVVAHALRDAGLQLREGGQAGALGRYAER